MLDANFARDICQLVGSVHGPLTAAFFTCTCRACLQVQMLFTAAVLPASSPNKSCKQELLFVRFYSVVKDTIPTVDLGLQ